jgi:rhodanese-related sulfurtransferase
MNAAFTILLFGMRKVTVAALFLGCPVLAQYDGDNVRYATTSWHDLPAKLNEHPGALLLDVRSPGEFNDTSRWKGLNIGRLEGAVNVPIDSIAVRYDQLLPYKERPIYVYCSHSQRSRRVCTQLADSGFTRLTNVNGGLSYFYRHRAEAPGLEPLVRSDLPFTFVNAAGLCDLMDRGAQILDVRADTAVDPGRMSDHQRAMGRLRGALHLPMDKLAGGASMLSRERPIVIVDEFGASSPVAARQLRDAGFTQLHVLFDGLDELFYVAAADFSCKTKIWERDLPYRCLALADLSPTDLASWHAIDIRPRAEFDQNAERPWRNIGRLRGIANYPADSLIAGASLPMQKNEPILLLGFSNDDKSYQAARILAERGYTNVALLVGGLWYLRWSAHNVEGMSAWEELVEQPPPVRPGARH